MEVNRTFTDKLSLQGRPESCMCQVYKQHMHNLKGESISPVVSCERQHWIFSLRAGFLKLRGAYIWIILCCWGNCPVHSFQDVQQHSWPLPTRCQQQHPSDYNPKILKKKKTPDIAENALSDRITPVEICCLSTCHLGNSIYSHLTFPL